MEGGGKLALAILLIFVAMVMFFFTFHPGGVEGVSNPAQMLQWLFSEFDTTTGADAATDAATLTPAQSYPGYTSSNDVGTAPAQTGVQVA